MSSLEWNERAHLFREQAVHNEDQHPLKAVEDCEDVGHGQWWPLKLKTAKDPHGAEHTQLGDGGDCEWPVGNRQRFNNLLADSRRGLYLKVLKQGNIIKK